MLIDTSLELVDSRAFAQATPIIPLTQDTMRQWLDCQIPEHRSWVQDTAFKAQSGSLCLLPSSEGHLKLVLLGVDSTDDYWQFGDLSYKLPPGYYRIDSNWSESSVNAAALAWGLGAYRFERYKRTEEERPKLVCVTTPTAFESIQNQIRSTYLVRDLINTPAADMMPQDLATTVERLAEDHSAEVKQVVGDELLAQHYSIIHTVGRASEHAPRLIDMVWGRPEHPKVTLIGKGVCFDSGGLNVKPGKSMRLMKKDMGGAAHVIGLASLVMSAKLPVRMRVLIPAVENAISAGAYRPGDVLRSRQGIAIEVDNTDAEGRLVLCDVLAEAASEKPELIADFATLTGAARIALGTELPGFFTNNKALSIDLMRAAEQVGDPVWPLPLHQPYRYLLDSKIADIVNSTTEPFAGAITAALFLQEFIPRDLKWVHFDVMGWNSRSRPGRPIGGEAMGMRATYAYLQQRFASERGQ